MGDRKDLNEFYTIIRRVNQATKIPFLLVVRVVRGPSTPGKRAYRRSEIGRKSNVRLPD